MFDVALTGATSEPMIGRIAMTRAINRMSGGTVVRPWDDDTFAMLEMTGWLDAFRAMQNDVQPMRDGLRKIEAAKAAILSKHPKFRKN